jgi:hypothetical protein
MKAADSRRLWWLALIGAASCGGGTPSDAADALRSGAVSASGSTHEASPEEIIPDGAPPRQLLALKAKKYAQGMVVEGSVIDGDLPEGGHSDHLTVLRGGYCYRVIGAGVDAVEDLDLVLYDPNGVQVQQDPAEDRFPLLGVGSDICPAVAGAFRIQVQMYKGSGAFAVGVYRTL